MNRIQAGLLVLGTIGYMTGARAAVTSAHDATKSESVKMLTPEQAQAYEVQAQQTDRALGESEQVIQGDMSAEAWGRISCYARDAFRVTYRVTAYNYPPQWIQREAVRYCRSISRVPWTCQALGCQQW